MNNCTSSSQFRSRWLILAGLADASVSVLHLIIAAVGPAAYRYFGAPSLAPLAEQGSWTPALETLAIAGVFAVFSLYAFSGAGLLRRLPGLRPILFAIGFIYCLRGLVLFVELYLLAIGKYPTPHLIVFSAVSLVIGALHLVGTGARPAAQPQA